MWGTLPDVLDRACTYYRESTAIIDGDRALTYAQMRDLRDRIAQALVSLGVQKGERVGLLLSNCLEFIPAQHGIWAAGGVLVQMPTRNAAAGFRANLLGTDATTLVYESGFDDAVSEIRADLPKLQNVIRISRDGSAAPAGVGEAHDFAALVDAQRAVRPDVGSPWTTRHMCCSPRGVQVSPKASSIRTSPGRTTASLRVATSATSDRGRYSPTVPRSPISRRSSSCRRSCAGAPTSCCRGSTWIDCSPRSRTRR